MNQWLSENVQFERPYHSTVALEEFLSRHGCFRPDTEIIDVGCGIGAAPYYFRSRHPDVRFLGTDYNAEKIAIAKRLVEQHQLDGLSYEVADWFNLPDAYVDRFDGVVSIHAVCCLKRIEDALNPFFALRPRWIAINSLFYEGPLDVLIHIRNHNNPDLADDNPDADFNTFSLTRTAQLCKENGYDLRYEPFFPPEPLAPRPDGGRGTYTMRTERHERTQFSGPVHLPWYFVLATRID